MNRTTQFLRRVLLFVLAVPFASCMAEVEDEYALGDVGRSDDPLYYLSDGIWGDTMIPVCWETAGDETEKGWVQEVMTGPRSWSNHSRIQFIGWGMCAPDSVGIRITGGWLNVVWGGLGESDTGISEMELDFTASPETIWTRCIDNGLDRRSCIEATAIHEFGHALSYAHEHNRPDTPATCTDAPQGSNGDEVFGRWDDESIMNYCSTAINLSDYDIVGTMYLYGRRVDHQRGNFDGMSGVDFAVTRHVGGKLRWFIDTDHDGTEEHNIHYGFDTDLPVPADYNGDGATDLAVVRKVGNSWRWYVDTNLNGATNFWKNWGISTDIPVPGNYGGTIADDFAIVRQSGNNLVWYFDTNHNGITNYSRTFGLSSSIPVPADYDGDGVTDLAVALGFFGGLHWYIDTDRDGYSDHYVAFGSYDDIPVVGDYDNDGNADVAYVTPVGGNWQWNVDTDLDGTADISETFGSASYRPMPGDFDGNNSTDFAVTFEIGGDLYWFFDRNLDGSVSPGDWGSFGIESDWPL